ncbi:MAG: hypothetical protein HY898_04505 [Deltaproteobacteria bacterium]|nr:hypothetical protein [Deltaproteobacteria bacterium]
MKRFAIVALATLACACGAPPKTPQGGTPGALAAHFGRAQAIEQDKSSDAALKAMLDVLDLAVDSASSPESSQAAAAALDALTGRRVFGMDVASGRSALAFRVKDGAATVLARLDAAWERAKGRGWIRPLIASSALQLCLHAGDAPRAKQWRARTGCARKATVVGPLDWAGLGALERTQQFEQPNKPLEATYPGLPPFGAAVHPQVTEADGCELETDLSSNAVGLRAVIVDVDSPAPRRIWLGVTSSSAAVVSVSGQPVVRRAFDAGGGRVTRIGTVNVTSGRARVVVRLAQRDDGNRVTLSLWDDDGMPVAAIAPAVGEFVNAIASNPVAVTLQPRAGGADDLALTASALLALGDGRGAEKLLEGPSRKPDAPPMLVLEYARALGVGSALPEVRKIERQREAFERALTKLPTSWEAAVGLATLAGQRRGMNEGKVEALAELKRLRERGVPAHGVLDAFEAAMASSAGMQDRAEQALSRGAGSLAGAPMLHAIEGLVHKRAGRDLIALSCGATAEHDSLGCFEAHVAGGDSKGAVVDLDRMRALHDSPSAFRDVELAQVIAQGDGARALALYDALPAGRRVTAALGLVASSKPEAVRERLARDLPDMSDGPDAALSLRRLLRATDEASYDALGSKLVAADRAKRAMPEAATLVIEHTESYLLGKRGVLLYTLYDLRRVAGTTDVEQGAQAIGAMVEGRDAHRVLRRRIHKKDGRVLEPDQAAHASQEHADLSQLEQGDYVEQLVSGVALPGNMGQIVVDTPDLLPQRTSVLHASIEVRYPKGVRISRWAHKTLQAAQEREDGDQKVWTLELRNHGPRRLESGVPKMEQEVNVAFGSQTWGAIARGMGEVVQAMTVRDPAVSAFARSAAGDDKGSQKVLEKLVAAIGKKVKVSSGAALSDSAAALGTGSQETSARTILELGQGSRTWLAWQALTDLGIGAEVVVAEAEPFASDPDFPAHVGRFEHPLLIARVAGDNGKETWLDLDVSGPPLPPGKVSPELRGRSAMRINGEMLKVPAGSETGPDEVDIRLTVDERGDAKGTVTMMLRGRAAQVLLDAFEDKAGSDRKDMLRSVVLGWIPWANVDEVVTSSAEGSWQLGVRASVTIPGFAQPEGSTWVLSGMTPLHVVTPQPVSATIASTFAGQGARENALAIESAWHYHLHRRIELPAGWQVQKMPAGIHLDDPHLQADRKAAVDATVLDETFELSIPTGTIPASEFDDFAAKARQVDDAFLSSFRVGKTQGRGK